MQLTDNLTATTNVDGEAVPISDIITHNPAPPNTLPAGIHHLLGFRFLPAHRFAHLDIWLKTSVLAQTSCKKKGARNKKNTSKNIIIFDNGLYLSIFYKELICANLSLLLYDVSATLLSYVFTVAMICIDTATDQTINSSIIQHIQWHLHPVKDGEHQVHS